MKGTPNPQAVGLCSTCEQSRRVASSKGSVFWMCAKATTDPRYLKYPPLPVRHCPGFEQKRSDGQE